MPWFEIVNIKHVQYLWSEILLFGGKLSTHSVNCHKEWNYRPNREAKWLKTEAQQTRDTATLRPLFTCLVFFFHLSIYLTFPLKGVNKTCIPSTCSSSTMFVCHHLTSQILSFESQDSGWWVESVSVWCTLIDTFLPSYTGRKNYETCHYCHSVCGWSLIFSLLVKVFKNLD